MALTLTAPNGGEYFYAYSYNDTDMNMIYNPITFTKTTAGSAEVYIYYSIDGGSNYTKITNIFETTSSTSPVATITATGGGTADTVYWSLDDTEWTTILSDFENDTVLLKVKEVSSGTEIVSAANFTVRQVSFASLIPNNSYAVVTNKSHVNIIWTGAYDADISNVDIQYKVGTGSWTNIATDIDYSLGGYLWHPYSDSGLISSSYSNVQLRIFDSDESRNIYYSELQDDVTDGFTIQSTPDIGPDTGDEYNPERFETFARTAGEKAILPDEFPTLTQFEAGDGIVIKQRDYDGKLTGDSSNAPYKAWNVVISVDDDTNVRMPRTLQGELNMAESGTIVRLADDEYYGTVVSMTISHGWGLGDSADPCYISTPWAQTANSWDLYIQQIEATGDDPDEYRLNHQYDVKTQAETIDEDTIKIYCTIKGTEPVINDGGGSGTRPDSRVPLSKDKLGFDPGTYKFEYRLTEVIPYTTTCT